MGLPELKLKGYESQFQPIYESLNLGVWSWDVHFRKILYVSPMIETISGIKAEEFLGGFRIWKEIVHPEDRAEFERNQRELRSGRYRQYQYRIIDQYGAVKWIEAHTFPVYDSDGRVVRLDGLINDISSKKLEEERINYFAYHDYLTGLPNRRMFERNLVKLMDEKKAGTEQFALLYLDLDRFKFINDTLGHSLGDELLKAVSKRLASLMHGEQQLVRLGGDEFAIIMSRFSDVSEAIHLASSIVKEIEREFHVKDYNLHITTSIGIGIYPQDGRTVDELLANADAALYRAKGMGKNNLQLYSPSMNSESYQWFTLERDLRNAAMDDEFILHYQPKVDPVTKTIVGAEALVRWNHPTRGLLGPNKFIPLAEETNLIFDLGDWVIRTVCKQIKQWKEQGQTVVPISINLSAKRFLKDNLVEKIGRILKDTNVEPEWIELEITETALIQNEERAAAMITQLKEKGITISLDDFGTGYSSISYLKKYKVDYLKIEGSFINGIFTSTDDMAIVKSILYLARELQIKVVAEGVETVEQLEFLLEHQCDLIQGYLFSKPVGSEEFTKLVNVGIM